MLLSAIEAATNPVSTGKEIGEIIGLIRDEHLGLAGALGLKGEVEGGVREDCGSVLEFLRAAQVRPLASWSRQNRERKGGS